jgi:hypothetical protein
MTAVGKKASCFFQSVRDSTPSPIGMSAFRVIEVESWRKHPAPGEFLEAGYVERVIKVSVGENDGSDIGLGFSVSDEGFFDPKDAIEKPFLDQGNLIIRDDERVLDKEPVELDDFPHGKKVLFFC